MITEKMKRLYRECQDTQLVQYLIKNHMDLDMLEWETVSSAPFDNTGTLLYVASFENRIGLVKALLKAGASPNVPCGPSKLTALHIACSLGHTQVVRLLLDFNADMVLEDVHGLTALTFACFYDHPTVIKALAHKKIAIDQPNTQGLTALMMMAKLGAEKGIQTLLSLGANPNAVSREQLTPIAYVILNPLFESDFEGKFEKILSLFLRAGVKPDETVPGTNYPPSQLVLGSQEIVKKPALCLFQTAIATTPKQARSALKTIRELAVQICKHTFEDPKDLLALYLTNSAVASTLPEAKNLINAGVSFSNSEWDTDWNNLLLACLQGNILSVKNLLRKSIQSDDAHDIPHCGPLDMACFTGNITLIDFLEDQEDEKLNTCSNGLTPLIIASRYGHLDLVKNRLDKDDLNTIAPKEQPLSALATACGYEHMAIAQLLMSHPRIAADPKALELSALANNPVLVNKLLTSALKWNETDRSLPLILACKENLTKLALDQIKRGINVNVLNDGCSPLQYATMQGNQVVVKHLLRREAEKRDTIELAAASGHVAILKILDQHFHFSQAELNQGLCKAAGEGQLEAVYYLLSKGADPNSNDKNNKTPLNFAMKYSHVNVVRLLLQKGCVIPTIPQTGEALAETDESAENHVTNLLKLVETYGYSVLRDDISSSCRWGCLFSSKAPATPAPENLAENLSLSATKVAL